MSILIKQHTNIKSELQLQHYAIANSQLTDNIADILEQELKAILQNQPKALIIDFSKVENISENATDLFLALEEALNENNNLLAIYGCSPALEDIIDGYDLLQLLAPCDTLEEAIEEVEADNASLLNDFDI